MYMILNHIWNVTRSKLKTHADSGRGMAAHEIRDSANFLFSLAKRARKYYLGVTTINQDVEDFMASKMGRAIVSNSSMQMLLKQSPSAVDVLADVFKLTDEERKHLSNLRAGVYFVCGRKPRARTGSSKSHRAPASYHQPSTANAARRATHRRISQRKRPKKG